MATNLDRLRNIQMSTNSAESAYDTADTVDSKILVNAGVIPDDSVEVIDNLDLIGGTEEPGNATLISQSLTFPMAQTRVKPHTLAAIASFALGSVTTTAAGGSAATTKRHKIVPAASTTMNSFTMEGLLKTGLQNKYSGCVVDGFNLSFTRQSNRFCDLTASILGSGTTTSGTATASEVAEGGLNAATAAVWLTNAAYDGTPDEVLAIGSTDSDLAGNPAALGANVIGFEWDYQNNIDPGFLYTIGSGDQFGIAERTARSQTVTLTLLWQDETYRANMISDDDMALQLKIRNAEVASESFYYGINLIFPKLRIQSRPRSEQSGRIIETITFTVLEHATQGSVELNVFNIQTAYMA